MIEIAHLEVSTLYLFKEQTHPGRCVVAYKEHAGGQTDIPEGEWVKFMLDTRRAVKAIEKAFGPERVNWGAYSDTLDHPHWHLVPKYKDGPEWGGVFAMNPKETYLTDEEYASVISKIREAL